MLSVKDFRKSAEVQLWSIFVVKSKKHRDFVKKINSIPLTKGTDPFMVNDIDEATELTEKEWENLSFEFEKLLDS